MAKTHIGYNMKRFKLVDQDGKTMKVGDVLDDSSGGPVKLEAIHAPHKPDSSGHVSTTGGYYYPSIYGLKFLEVQ